MNKLLTNAKEEFVKHTSSRKILCAIIKYEASTLWKAYGMTGPISKQIALGVNHTPEDYQQFLEELNFEYDSSYGGQELYGTIWYTDNSWSERREYDGSEWWSFMEIPNIPHKLTTSSLIVELETDYWDGDESNEPF